MHTKYIEKASGILGQSVHMNSTLDLSIDNWKVNGGILSTDSVRSTYKNAGPKYTTDKCPTATERKWNERFTARTRDEY